MAHVQSIGAPGTPASQRTRLHGSIFRFHPVTSVFEALSSGTVNPWGQDWDKYGEHFFDSTIVGHLWYEMPGAKFVSSSAEPNLKAYELIDHIADHRFAGGSTAGPIIAPERAEVAAAEVAWRSRRRWRGRPAAMRARRRLDTAAARRGRKATRPRTAGAEACVRGKPAPG